MSSIIFSVEESGKNFLTDMQQAGFGQRPTTPAGYDFFTYICYYGLMLRLTSALLESMHFRAARPRIALLLGPRGVGKSFLAQALQDRRGSPGVCASWDDWGFRKGAISSPYAIFDKYQPLLFNKNLALIDEFEKAPRRLELISDFFNAHSEKIDFIATSSYSYKLTLHNKDFISSKCSTYHIHPFSLSEILQTGFLPNKDKCDRIIGSITTTPPNPGRRGNNAFDLLFKLGGFPMSFVCQSEKKNSALIKERHDRLIHDDLRDMTRLQQLPGVENLIDMMSPGSLLSFNSMKNKLGVNGATVRLWLDHLERLHYCFRVEPFSGKMPRTLRNANKLYLWDWSAVDGAELRFENLTACALLRWCHFAQDWGGENLRLHFIRDKERRSVPFLLTLDGRPRLLVATAVGESGPMAHLKYFSARLKVPAVLVATERKFVEEDDGVKLMPATSFLAAIP
jgi:predicted AAA+ superfamily ATPase